MNFFDYKKQAEKDGMDVKTNTTKKDIELFYANKETKQEIKKKVTKKSKHNPKDVIICPKCGFKTFYEKGFCRWCNENLG